MRANSRIYLLILTNKQILLRFYLLILTNKPGLVKNFWLICKTLPQVCGAIFLWHYHNKKQPFWTAFLLSGKRDSNSRCARIVAREFIFTPPTPGRGVWGRFVRAIILHNKKKQPFWTAFLLSGKRDSNSRPQPWQGCALPTELFPQH